jgi:hypothetical protein
LTSAPGRRWWRSRAAAIGFAAIILTAAGAGAATAYILSRKPHSHERTLAAIQTTHRGPEQSASSNAVAPAVAGSTPSTSTASSAGTSSSSSATGPADVIRQHLEHLGSGQYQQAFALMTAAYRADNPDWVSDRAAADPGINVI